MEVSLMQDPRDELVARLGGFTVFEIIELLRSRIPIPRNAKRRRHYLIAFVRTLDLDLATAILTEVAAKVGNKRVRVPELPSEEPPPKRRVVLLVNGQRPGSSDPSKETPSFLEPVPPSVVSQCITNFIDRTNNASLTKGVCMCCARRLFGSQLRLLCVADIPNPDLLKPTHPHPAHQLTDGMLLHLPAARERHTFICDQCYDELRKAERPALALANNMWIGAVPFQLDILTLAERLLVALYFPAAYIVKFYMKGKYGKGGHTNSGLRGNVSTYPLNTEKIAHMIEGSILPRPPQLLAAVIGVTFVGVTQQPLFVLSNMFTVRRKRVWDALLWLRANNPLYRNLHLSTANLDLLPEDGVPDEILSNVREVSGDHSGLREQSGYVPESDEEDEDDPTTAYRQGLREFGPASSSVGVSSDIRPMVNDEDFQQRGAPPEGNVFSSIPVSSSGIVDVDGQDIPESELFLHAVQHLADEESLAKFNVQRGSRYVNEYPRVRDGVRFDGGPESANHLLGSFPCLFPYGTGGFEVDRERKVTYEAHSRWALQYEDGRFKKDFHFIFIAFGVRQKRLVCYFASVQISRETFAHHHPAFLALRVEDFLLASAEEEKRVPYSNPVMAALRRQLTTIRARVVGTDESRIAIRAQIWGMTLRFNPPTLWTTINLSDTGDPIAQFLAGQEIDLDRFVASAGPSSSARNATMAADPFSAAEFFHVTVRILLEEMFGIRVGVRGIERTRGIVGTVNGYVGTVEAQGRGTLHLHILFWLAGAPTAGAMREALRTSQFRDRIRRFIAQNIRADVAQSDPASFLRNKTKRRNASFCRPVDPRSADYAVRSVEAEGRLARAVQVHECSIHNCLVSRQGRIVCKRRAPWPLSDVDWVDEEGNWGPKRRVSHLNNWNPALLQVTRANHDMKLITNGAETKDITFYITLYIAKRQIQAANASALLAGSFDYHRVVRGSQPPEKNLNLMLLEQCANTLSRRQELSAPEVISYLMGWGDRYISHHYVRLNWMEFTFAIRKIYPGIARFQPSPDAENLFAAAGEESSEQDNRGTLAMEGGQFVLKDQLAEYVERGDELEDLNVYEYFTRTYHGKPLPDGRNVSTERDSREARASSRRVAYASTSLRSGCRIVRGKGNECNLHVIGPWFIRNDDPRTDYYRVQMLTLLKPWRSLALIHEPFSSIEEAWVAFNELATPDIRRLLENIQYYHDCVASVGRTRAEIPPAMDEHQGLSIGADEGSDVELDSAPPLVTEETIHQAMLAQYSERTSRYGEHAILLARSLGIFLEAYDQSPWKPYAVKATEAEARSFRELGVSIANRQRTTGLLPVVQSSVGDFDGVGALLHPPNVLATRNVGFSSQPRGPSVTVAIPSIRETCATGSAIQLSTGDALSHLDSLNSEQRLAHDIVHNHLRLTLEGRNPEQLLMIIQGEGGTGKTVLLRSISATFEALGASSLLSKTATTGVAASLFGGQTLHNWAAIPARPSSRKRSTESSSKPNQKRVRNITPVKYLVIDEFSMLTKETLYALSNIIGEIKSLGGSAPASRPFGNINVILVGDPHQFPPVGNPRGALYANLSDGTLEAELGRAMYLQFRTVVTLTQQRRVVDPVWTALLRRLRTGSCTAADMDIINSVLIQHPSCSEPSWQTPPWSQAVLVTPRHSCRTLWNSCAVRKHEALTGNPVYVSIAEDVCTTDWQPLSLDERFEIAQMTQQATGKLAHRVELSVGMKAMVLLNIATDADLSNGTRGEIVDIKLDPRESEPLVRESLTGFVRLQYPPVLVLFRPDGGSAASFEGIPLGVVPVVPSARGFRLAGRKSIRRHQLPMTPGYSFTDYKSQGQTIEHVLVDLQQPPNGGLTAFHAYVSLSRSRGRDNIRILRGYDAKIFTTHPSEDLKDEDARLDELTRKTREAFGP